MDKDDKWHVEDLLGNYRDRVARITAMEPESRLRDPYLDGFIRGLLLAINDLEGLLSLEKRP